MLCYSVDKTNYVLFNYTVFYNRNIMIPLFIICYPFVNNLWIEWVVFHWMMMTMCWAKQVWRRVNYNITQTFETFYFPNHFPIFSAGDEPKRATMTGYEKISLFESLRFHQENCLRYEPLFLLFPRLCWTHLQSLFTEQ